MNANCYQHKKNSLILSWWDIFYQSISPSFLHAVKLLWSIVFISISLFFGHKLSKSFDWPQNLDRTKYSSIKVAVAISKIENQRRLFHISSFVFAPKFLYSLTKTWEFKKKSYWLLFAKIVAKKYLIYKLWSTT